MTRNEARNDVNYAIDHCADDRRPRKPMQYPDAVIAADNVAQAEDDQVAEERNCR